MNNPYDNARYLHEYKGDQMNKCFEYFKCNKFLFGYAETCVLKRLLD